MMPLPLPSADTVMTDAPPLKRRLEGGGDDSRSIKRVCFQPQPSLAAAPSSCPPAQDLPPHTSPPIHIVSGQQAEESVLEVVGLDTVPLESAEMEELFGETEIITDCTDLDKNTTSLTSPLFSNMGINTDNNKPDNNKLSACAQEELPTAPAPRPFRHTSPGFGGSRTASPASSENEFIDDDDEYNSWADIFDAEPAGRITRTYWPSFPSKRLRCLKAADT